MNKLILTITVSLCLSGCTNTGWFANKDNKAKDMVTSDGRIANSSNAVKDTELVYIETARVNMLGEYSSKQPNNAFVDDGNFQSAGNQVIATGGRTAPKRWDRGYGEPMVKNINHYVRGIMHNLVDNIHYINDKTPIGVASFVYLDSTYKHSNILGNQIAESFMHEVHQFGIPVIDFKTTDYLRVTEHGDFIFSRDFLELKDELPIKYILAGTLVKHQSGYLVNARIVGLTSKAIVASAQGFIPNAIADALLPTSTSGNDGIILMQGE